jgi:2-phosphosulfolactate phosphatase
VNVVHATGIAGAQSARGVVVVIDVLRSFTVSAYALAGGARECLLVTTVDRAQTLARRIAGAVVCAEEDALPVDGVAISNSPTQIAATDLEGRTLIQRSSAGTPVMDAVREGDAMFAGSLVVAGATAQACLLRKPSTVTLVASADFPEDHACAKYLEGLLTGRKVDASELDSWLEPLRASDRYRRVMAGQWPGFPPTDLELSLQPDRFDFAMPVSRRDGYLSVGRESHQDRQLA